MPFAAAAEIPPSYRGDRFAIRPAVVARPIDFESSRFGVYETEMREVVFGKLIYPLRVPSLRGFYTPPAPGRSGQFRVQELASVVGVGGNVSIATKDWAEKFHVEIQTLISRRPFEMDRDEAIRWDRISSIIDVPAYLQSLLVKVRRRGVVRDMRPGHYAVDWDNGETQRVRLEQMPDQFAAFKPGQPFEALVVYRPDGLDLVSVEYVAKRSVPPRVSAADQRKIWDSLSTTREMPKASW